MAENGEDWNGLEMKILKSLAIFFKIHEWWCSPFKSCRMVFCKQSFFLSEHKYLPTSSTGFSVGERGAGAWARTGTANEEREGDWGRAARGSTGIDKGYLYKTPCMQVLVKVRARAN